mgnify:CR=1 FL=1
MILETFLILAALPFVGLTIFFGTKGGYYDSDDYKGDGCAHDVQRWNHSLKSLVLNGLDLHQL